MLSFNEYLHTNELEEDKGMSGYNKFKKEWRAKHGDTKPVPGYDSKEHTSYVYRQNDKKQGVAEEIVQEKRGLWDNIHSKRKRIAAGSGERMRKPGSEGAPTKQNFIDAQESAAWQRKEGKSESGGLNQKGIASYRRENPGSKLSMAVTTKPSKLKKDSKAANRRKSFCARMGGMKRSRTSAKTARDPDSRINKALRKWNC